MRVSRAATAPRSRSACQPERPPVETLPHYGASNNRNGLCLILITADFAPRSLSKTASIGPSDKMLPWLATEGAYKLEALPPSRNKALGQFSPSRNRRAQASTDTSP